MSEIKQLVGGYTLKRVWHTRIVDGEPIQDDFEVYLLESPVPSETIAVMSLDSGDKLYHANCIALAEHTAQALAAEREKVRGLVEALRWIENNADCDVSAGKAFEALDTFHAKFGEV